MPECFKCGATSDRAILVDAIVEKGIKKICLKCSRNEDIPIIRKPSLLKIEESEKKESVYERMKKVAGIKEENKIQNPEAKTQEKELRNLVEENFRTNFSKANSHEDLIENFHWILMRTRRLKKVTIEQLAEKINESIESVKLAEKGILPQDYSRLIKKLEDFLSVRLFKEEFIKKERAIEIVPAEALGKPEEIFEKNNSRILSISDLQELKDKYEDRIFHETENMPEFIEVKEAP
jgi:ribosome-binding protein aMBF1 (putative translation factor)